MLLRQAGNPLAFQIASAMTSPMPTLRRLGLLFVTLLGSAGYAQTLARPGWAGSGLSSDAWWKHAVVYQVDPKGFTEDGVRGVTQRLGYIRSLGADAVLLTDKQIVDPAGSGVDDVDDLIHEASSREIRVLLTLDTSQESSPIARFWLNHGVAGFYAPGATAPQLADLKKTINSFVGQRILVGDLNVSDAEQDHESNAPQMLTEPRAGTVPQLTATSVRAGLEASQAMMQSGRVVPLLLSDGPSYARSFSRYGDRTHDIDIAKTLATVLFASHAGTLLYFGQELGLASAPDKDGAPPEIHWDAPPKPKPGAAPAPPANGANAAVEDGDPASLLNWYRQLSALHHTNRTISSGAQIILNHDDQNVLVWVRKPQAVSPQSPAIVIVCNLSAQPVQISLKADMQRLHLRGSFLRAVLRSDNAMGAMHLDGMTLAPFTTYIGELRF